MGSRKHADMMENAMACSCSRDRQGRCFRSLSVSLWKRVSGSRGTRTQDHLHLLLNEEDFVFRLSSFLTLTMSKLQ